MFYLDQSHHRSLASKLKD